MITPDIPPRSRQGVRLCALLGLALFWLGSASPARAEDRGVEGPHFRAELVNEAGGAVFRVEGRTTPLPDGATLVVNLVAKGRAKDVSCALFRVPVRGSCFRGSQRWPGRELAPLGYEARLELVVNRQAQAVKTWIKREYGYTDDHREILDSRSIALGSDAERVAFARQNLGRIHELTLELEELRAKAEAAMDAPAAESPAWGDVRVEINEGIVAYRFAVEEQQFRYVALLEVSFFARLKRANQDLARFVRDHDRGKRGMQKRVRRLAGQLRHLARTLASRMPRRSSEASSAEGPREDAR